VLGVLLFGSNSSLNASPASEATNAAIQSVIQSVRDDVWRRSRAQAQQNELNANRTIIPRHRHKRTKH
jgi:hypothetical protein